MWAEIATEGNMASTTTYGARMGTTTGVMKEDLSDVIANISPTR